MSYLRNSGFSGCEGHKSGRTKRNSIRSSNCRFNLLPWDDACHPDEHLRRVAGPAIRLQAPGDDLSRSNNTAQYLSQPSDSHSDLTSTRKLRDFVNASVSACWAPDPSCRAQPPWTAGPPACASQRAMAAGYLSVCMVNRMQDSALPAGETHCGTKQKHGEDDMS